MLFEYDVARCLDPVVDTTTSSRFIGFSSGYGSSMSAMKFSAMAERSKNVHSHIDLFSFMTADVIPRNTCFPTSDSSHVPRAVLKAPVNVIPPYTLHHSHFNILSTAKPYF